MPEPEVFGSIADDVLSSVALLRSPCPSWEWVWASPLPRTRSVFSIMKKAANPMKMPKLHERALTLGCTLPNCSKKRDDFRDQRRDVPNEDMTLLFNHYEMYGSVLMFPEKRMWYEVQKNIR
jgi:hypothetical protein